MESMETVKQELKTASVKILRDHLGPEVMKTLIGLTTIEGFPAITLGELITDYTVPPFQVDHTKIFPLPMGPKKFSIKDLLQTNPSKVRVMVLDFIKDNPGCARANVVEGLNLKEKLVTAAIKKLRDTGEIATFGAGRGTVYMVVDELSEEA